MHLASLCAGFTSISNNMLTSHSYSTSRDMYIPFPVIKNIKHHSCHVCRRCPHDHTTASACRATGCKKYFCMDCCQQLGFLTPHHILSESAKKTFLQNWLGPCCEQICRCLECTLTASIKQYNDTPDEDYKKTCHSCSFSCSNDQVTKFCSACHESYHSYCADWDNLLGVVKGHEVVLNEDEMLQTVGRTKNVFLCFKCKQKNHANLNDDATRTRQIESENKADNLTSMSDNELSESCSIINLAQKIIYENQASTFALPMEYFDLSSEYEVMLEVSE